PSVFRRSAVPDQPDVATPDVTMAVEPANGAPAVSSVSAVSGAAEGSSSAGAPPVPGAPASGSA
ncbi:MAG: hypothetical protein ACRDPO_25405, partial [Streptosporangiaceae bacterium]